jgi:hypothetical protein
MSDDVLVQWPRPGRREGEGQEVSKVLKGPDPLIPPLLSISQNWSKAGQKVAISCMLGCSGLVNAVNCYTRWTQLRGLLALCWEPSSQLLLLKLDIVCGTQGCWAGLSTNPLNTLDP